MHQPTRLHAGRMRTLAVAPSLLAVLALALPGLQAQGTPPTPIPADAVKVEGAGPTLKRARAIVEAGIPVMGHIGLTPQSAPMLGGYKAQGRTVEKARQLQEEALALEQAGCFAIVFEAIPEPVAARITAALREKNHAGIIGG